MSSAASISPRSAPQRVTGVELMRGIGVRPAVGFWADAWSQVMRRPLAVGAIVWLSIIAFFAVFSPLIANGHPVILRELAPDGSVARITSPMLRFATAIDVLLVIAVAVGLPIAWFLGARPRRATRMRALVLGLIAALASTLPATLLQSMLSSRTPPAWLAWAKGSAAAPWMLSAIGAVIVAGFLCSLPLGKPAARIRVIVAACVLGAIVSAVTWGRPLEQFDYVQREMAGEVRATYSLVPWSPMQRFSDLSRKPPLFSLAERSGVPADSPVASRRFIAGTDAFGTDVLTQLLHACRLSISIGLVSTGIALLIGVTMGALMGYFGGWIDLLLYRVVEIFMAVPVLFLLIVSVSVLPEHLKSTYTLMAIIGCFTWTGMARFTRAEFMKLRNQDFVQAARASGLPLRSVLFKHMLPNGVAPVLVDTSFAIAAAISIEATLSYLGLGAPDQASWGKLLSSAINPEGEFKWWLAVFPGVAIFLTVLSYNLIGEALRDAIDPKLKKARV